MNKVVLYCIVMCMHQYMLKYMHVHIISSDSARKPQRVTVVQTWKPGSLLFLLLYLSEWTWSQCSRQSLCTNEPSLSQGHPCTYLSYLLFRPARLRCWDRISGG